MKALKDNLEHSLDAQFGIRGPHLKTSNAKIVARVQQELLCHGILLQHHDAYQDGGAMDTVSQLIALLVAHLMQQWQKEEQRSLRLQAAEQHAQQEQTNQHFKEQHAALRALKLIRKEESRQARAHRNENAAEWDETLTAAPIETESLSVAPEPASPPCSISNKPEESCCTTRPVLPLVSLKVDRLPCTGAHSGTVARASPTSLNESSHRKRRKTLSLAEFHAQTNSPM